ncbi:restriction endonuclease subunit S [Photobacterium sp. GB-50]|uniref:restriction endonuclease subunit S n=1 Tax=Photobacterium sp. GB-50 TaxID=2022107 RepID=UPI000D159266|nr:restriction endonuclease subunit S [Photobacterium sp. GB-50]PSW72621.1 restriction endonuclease subunit S [Photobacterium sp. GB-50]
MSWPLVKLSDVAFFQEGPGVRKWQFRNEGIKLINVKNIVDEVLVTENSDKYLDPDEVEKKYSHFLTKVGDLVMASSGATWGKLAWVEEKHLPLCMNTSMIRFQSLDSNKLDIRYLFYYLKTVEFRRDMEKLVTGSAQPNFGSTHLKQISLPLPPLEEQKRIAAILDKADAIRQKRKQAIELADEFLRSVFLDMFGDPVTNPKGWEQVSLSTLSEKILNGTTPKGGSDVYVEKGIAFLRSQNVWKKRIDLDDIVYLDDETHTKMSKSSLKNKDILITKTGRINTENSSLGRAAIYYGKDDEANINGHVYLVRLKPDNVHEFIEFILTTKEYRDHIRAVCVGGIDKRQLNKNHIEEFPIICPPTDQQQRFVKVLHQSQKVMDNYKVQLVEAQNNLSALTQKAFSGQL